MSAFGLQFVHPLCESILISAGSVVVLLEDIFELVEGGVLLFGVALVVLGVVLDIDQMVVELGVVGR